MEALTNNEISAILAKFAEIVASQGGAQEEKDKTKVKLHSNKPHAMLRGRMKEMDITGSYLARKWSASQATISNSLSGKRPWTAWEMYDLMQRLNIDPEEMHLYFPDYRPKKGGRK